MNIERLTELGMSEENAKLVMEELSKEEAEKSENVNDFEAEKAAIIKKYEEDIKSIKIDNEVEKALTKAGAKNIKAVRALLDLENAEVNENGIVGLSDSIKKLKSGKDTEFLFEKTGFKGVSVGESTHRGEVNTDNMNYSQLCAYLEENPDVIL
jgi:hypothetical protein